MSSTWWSVCVLRFTFIIAGTGYDLSARCVKLSHAQRSRINSSFKRRVSMTAVSVLDPPNLPSNFSPSRHER